MASWRTLLTFFAFAMTISCTTTQTPSAPLQHATVLPTTTVRALDSSPMQLSAALQGRPALIALWATWCDACRDELPALKKLDTWAKNRGAVVVGVAVGESIAQVSTYTNANHVPYLILVDEEFHLADALGEKRVPTTLVIDKTGRIVHTGGALDDRALNAFRSLLPSDGDVAHSGL